MRDLLRFYYYDNMSLRMLLSMAYLLLLFSSAMFSYFDIATTRIGISVCGPSCEANPFARELMQQSPLVWFNHAINVLLYSTLIGVFVFLMFALTPPRRSILYYVILALMAGAMLYYGVNIIVRATVVSNNLMSLYRLAAHMSQT